MDGPFEFGALMGLEWSCSAVIRKKMERKNTATKNEAVKFWGFTGLFLLNINQFGPHQLVVVSIMVCQKNGGEGSFTGKRIGF